MADQKVTALDALATVDDADILYVIDDPSGTPTSKKITRLNLLTSAAIGGTVEATTLTDGTMTITGGDIASVGSITATTITDGTMSITGGDITSVGSITATTLTDGTATITGGAISTTGTLGCSTITMTENSDTVEISHNGTDAYFKTSDGYFRFETDEGTNTNSILWLKGKGTGRGYIVIQDGSDAGYYTQIDQTDAVGSINPGTSTTSIVVNENGADCDFRVESDTITHAIALDAGTNAVTLSAPNSATTPAANATLSFWIDETGHNLKVAVKYADGTAKTATVAFD